MFGIYVDYYVVLCSACSVVHSARKLDRSGVINKFCAHPDTPGNPEMSVSVSMCV